MQTFTDIGTLIVRTPGNLLLVLAIRNRGYTDKTHLRGFKTIDFSLVRAGGLCLCSSELYSPKTFKTSFEESSNN
ncbi:hypothetical protein [Nostoc piscinale]|uniref:hypothetical protein n=1 Tax=Nostoc piscinale TaxID=224012 RepID=UPI0039A65493